MKQDPLIAAALNVARRLEKCHDRQRLTEEDIERAIAVLRECAAELDRRYPVLTEEIVLDKCA